nr:hypothetical protein [Brucella abortus]
MGCIITSRIVVFMPERAHAIAENARIADDIAAFKTVAHFGNASAALDEKGRFRRERALRIKL